MLSESSTCPEPLPVANLPILTPDSDTYLVAETKTNQNTYITGKVSLPQAILNAGIPLTDTVIDTWVVTNSSNISAATAWFLANNVRVSKYVSWLLHNSANIVETTAWIYANSGNCTPTAASNFIQSITLNNSVYTTIVHGLNTVIPTVQVYDNNNAQVVVDVTVVNNNSISIKLETDVEGIYKVVVFGNTLHDVVCDNNIDNGVSYTWVTQNSAHINSVITNVIESSAHNTQTYNWVQQNSAHILESYTSLAALTAEENLLESVASWVINSSSTIGTMTTWFAVLTAVKEAHQQLEDSVFAWVINHSGVASETLALNLSVYQNWVINNSSDITNTYAWYHSTSSHITETAAWVSANSAEFDTLETLVSDALVLANQSQTWINNNGLNAITSSTWVKNNSSSINNVKDVVTTIKPIALASVDVINWWLANNILTDEVNTWIQNATSNWVEQIHIEALEELYNPIRSWALHTSADIYNVNTFIHSISAEYNRVANWVESVSGNIPFLNTTATWVSENTSTLENIATWYDNYAIDVSNSAAVFASVSASYDNAVETSLANEAWIETNNDHIDFAVSQAEWVDANKDALVTVVDQITSVVNSATAFNTLRSSILSSSNWLSAYSDTVIDAVNTFISVSASYDNAVETSLANDAWIASNNDHLDFAVTQAEWVDTNKDYLETLVEQTTSVVNAVSAFNDLRTNILSSSNWLSAHGVDVLNTVTVFKNASSGYQEAITGTLNNSNWIDSNSARLDAAVTQAEWVDANKDALVTVVDQITSVVNAVSAFNDLRTNILSSSNWLSTHGVDVLNTVTVFKNASSGYQEAITGTLNNSNWIDSNSARLDAAVTDTLNNSNWIDLNSARLDAAVTQAEWVDSNKETLEFTLATITSAASAVLLLAQLSANIIGVNSWVSSNSASVKNNVTTFAAASADYNTAVIESRQAVTWISQYTDAILQSINQASWVATNSSDVNDVLESYTSISSSINVFDSLKTTILQASAWLNANSGISVFKSLSASYNDAVISSLHASSWTNTNSSSISDIQNWYITNATLLEESTSLFNNLSSSILNVSAWVENNSTIVLDTLTTLRDLSSSTIRANNWVVSNSANTLSAIDTASWVADNQSDIEVAIDASNVFRMMQVDLQSVVQWVQDNTIALSGVASWADSASSQLSGALTITDWLENNQTPLSDLIENLTNIKSTVTTFADVSASLTAVDTLNLEQLNNTVSWVSNNDIVLRNLNVWYTVSADAINAASQWVVDNNNSIENSTNWVAAHSAVIQNVDTWAQTNSAYIQDSATWIHRVSSDIPSKLSVSAVFIHQNNIINTLASWIVSNSSTFKTIKTFVSAVSSNSSAVNNWVINTSSDVADTIEWVNDNKMLVSIIDNTLTHASSTIDTLDRWITDNGDGLLYTNVWVTQNRQALSAVESWFASNSTLVNNCNAWVKSNSATVVSVYSETIETNNVSGTYNVNHKLNADDILVQIFDETTGSIVGVDVTEINENNVTVSFGSNAAGMYKVVIFGNTDLFKQNVVQNSVTTWVLANSSRIDNAITFLKMLTGINEESEALERNVHSWVRTSSADLNAFLSIKPQVATLLGYTADIQSVIEWAAVARGELGNQSGISRNALASATKSLNWITTNSAAILDVDSWVVNHSSIANDVYVLKAWVADLSTTILNNAAWISENASRITPVTTWVHQNSSDVYDVSSWVHSNSSAVLNGINTAEYAKTKAEYAYSWVNGNAVYVADDHNWLVKNKNQIEQVNLWIEALTSTRESHEALETGVFSWVQNNSAILEAAVKNEYYSWILDNSGRIASIYNWHTNNDAYVASSVNWFNNEFVKTKNATAWVIANSSDVKTAYVNALYALSGVGHVQNWINSNQTKIFNVNSWVQVNSASLVNTAKALTWVTDNKDITSNVTTWIRGHSSLIADATTWLRILTGVQEGKEHAALEDAVFAWVVDNSAIANEVITWVSDSSSLIIDVDNWVQSNSSVFNDIYTYTKDTSASFLSAANWVLSNQADVLDASNWVYTNKVNLNRLYTTYAPISSNVINAYTWVAKFAELTEVADKWVFDNGVTTNNAVAWVQQNRSALDTMLSWAHSNSAEYEQAYTWVHDNSAEVRNIRIALTELQRDTVDSIEWVADYGKLTRDVITCVQANSALWALSGSNAELWTRTDGITRPVGSLSAGQILTGESAIQILTKMLYGAPFNIVTNPSSLVANMGDTVIFEVSATGDLVHYQWYHIVNGVPVQVSNGATRTLTVDNIVIGSGGTYYAQAYNDITGQTLNSTNAVLTVNLPVGFVIQPVNTTINEGDSFTLTTTVSGTTPITYVWFKDGAVISNNNALSTRLTRTSVTTVDAGVYKLSAHNVAGNAVSNEITVTVNKGLIWVTQPTGGTINPGQSLTLHASASGTGPISYQWYNNGSLINQATAVDYDATANGSYTVRATNSVGPITSNAAVVNVRTAPGFTLNPADTTVLSGNNATFTATSSGSPTITYRWYHRPDVTTVVGTGSMLTLTSITPSSSGLYFATATNDVSTVSSADAMLTVTLPVIAITYPIFYGKFPTNSTQLQSGDTAYADVTKSDEVLNPIDSYYSDNTLYTGPAVQGLPFGSNSLKVIATNSAAGIVKLDITENNFAQKLWTPSVFKVMNVSHYGQLQLTFQDVTAAFDTNYATYTRDGGGSVSNKYDLRTMFHWVFVPSDLPAPDGRWGTSANNLDKVFNVTDGLPNPLLYASQAMTMTLADGTKRLYDIYRISAAQSSKTFRIDV